MFEKRAIRPTKKRLLKAERWIQGHIVLSILAIAVGAFFLKGVVGAAKAGNPFSVKHIVLSAISQDIATDRYNHTNILLLGIGGEGHDGAHLTDTMIVASIDHKQKLVPMLSIPRDFYVDNETVGWGTRLNSIYELVLDKTESEERAMAELQMEIEKLLDIEIHYYAMIDFNGFVDIVDAIDGVDLTLEESFYDPFYPAAPGSTEDFQAFYLNSGEQNLDGEEALKYARSRKTTSDFDRARRQQEILAAIKDKAVSLGILLNPARLKELYIAVSSNFDTNITWTEMVYLAKLADQFDRDSIISEVLNDEPYRTGGFLYTPEREEFGGAFVLVPFSGDNTEIQTFAQLLLYHPELYVDGTPLQVLNGTKEAGLAAMTKMYLTRYGFNVVRFGNGLDRKLPKTNIFTNRELDEKGEKTLEIIPSLVFGNVLDETPDDYLLEQFPTDAEIIIELGEDFLDYYQEYDERFYVGFY